MHICGQTGRERWFEYHSGKAGSGAGLYNFNSGGEDRQVESAGMQPEPVLSAVGMEPESITMAAVRPNLLHVEPEQDQRRPRPCPVPSGAAPRGRNVQCETIPHPFCHTSVLSNQTGDGGKATLRTAGDFFGLGGNGGNGGDGAGLFNK